MSVPGITCRAVTTGRRGGAARQNAGACPAVWRAGHLLAAAMLPAGRRDADEDLLRAVSAGPVPVR